MRSAISSIVVAIVFTIGPPNVSAAPEACSLLSKDIAAAALGEAVSGPKPAASGAATACEFTGSGLHKIHLNVFQLTPDQAAYYKTLCDKKGKEGLSGLGPTACWYNDKHAELQVLKGTTFFSIEMNRSGDPTESIKTAAKKVLDQIK